MLVDFGWILRGFKGFVHRWGCVEVYLVGICVNRVLAGCMWIWRLPSTPLSVSFNSLQGTEECDVALSQIIDQWRRTMISTPGFDGRLDGCTNLISYIELESAAYLSQNIWDSIPNLCPTNFLSQHQSVGSNYINFNKKISWIRLILLLK